MKNIAGADIRPAWRITARIQERCKCLPAQNGQRVGNIYE